MMRILQIFLVFLLTIYTAERYSNFLFNSISLSSFSLKKYYRHNPVKSGIRNPNAEIINSDGTVQYGKHKAVYHSPDGGVGTSLLATLPSQGTESSESTPS